MSTPGETRLKPTSTEVKGPKPHEEQPVEPDSADLRAKLDHHNADMLGQQRNRLAHPHDVGS